MSENSGRFSKFQERIRNIRLSRSKKMRFQRENEQFVLEKVNEIKKKVRADGGVYRVRVAKGIGEDKKKEEQVVTEIQDKSLPKSLKKDFSKSEVKDISISSDKKKEDTEVFLEDKKKNVSCEEKVKVKDNFVKKDNSKKVGIEERKEEIKENSSLKEKSHFVKKVYSKKSVGISNDSEEKIKELGSEIVNKIKDQFENYLDEVDVLSSELFLIKNKQDNEVELAKVLELKKKINELIKKLNHIIEQYNLYKRNNYIDAVIGIEDSSIVDDMIEYRELLDSDKEKKKFTSQYKTLEEFQHLYFALQEVREDTVLLMEENRDKVLEYQERDDKHRAIRSELADEVRILCDCDEEIKKQNDSFDKLMKNIGNIDKIEYMTYELRGMDKFLENGLRYVGLMMLSPLGGLFPSIGVQAFLTRRIVQNAYRGIHLEEKKNIRYEAIDEERDILSKITDIRYTSYLVDDTLSHVERLKNDFLLHYSSNLPHYEDTLEKILKIEKMILHQQNKIDIIQKKLLKGKKMNQEKMIKVKKLNENNL